MARAARTHYTVSYDSESHISVLTQMWGSKWPELLPYCIFNVLLMIFITYIDNHYEGKYSIEITKQGHTFITLVVAFLLVSRVNIALNRYNEARTCLGTMYRECRELIQNACVFSDDALGTNAKEWRHELAYRTLLLLRTSMAVIDYPVTKVPAWEIPELNGDERTAVQQANFLNPDTKRWSHVAERSMTEEVMRVPIQVAYLCRKTVFGQSQRLGEQALHIAQEGKLLGSIDAFMGGYYGLRRFMTTPVPFPLIQMSRTFLFLYVFTVPFVMLGDESSLFSHCFMVFVLTYGFVGLELVAIEMDNPFGDDANDFNNAALAMVAYEDTYLTVLDVDGTDWADKLRVRMHDQSADLTTEQSWLLGSNTIV